LCYKLFFTKWGYWPHAQPPTRRTRGFSSRFPSYKLVAFQGLRVCIYPVCVEFSLLDGTPTKAETSHLACYWTRFVAIRAYPNTGEPCATYIYGPSLLQDLVIPLGAVRYPISNCYLEEDPTSGPHRSNCGEAKPGREDLRKFCFFFTACC
jgi:hypothetical protein